jgi:hypothetical protein
VPVVWSKCFEKSFSGSPSADFKADYAAEALMSAGCKFQPDLPIVISRSNLHICVCISLLAARQGTKHIQLDIAWAPRLAFQSSDRSRSEKSRGLLARDAILVGTRTRFFWQWWLLRADDKRAQRYDGSMMKICPGTMPESSDATNWGVFATAPRPLALRFEVLLTTRGYNPGN